MTDPLLARLDELAKRLEILEAEADIRRLQARYMLLCDTPCPAPEVGSDAQRIDAIMALYAEDAVWEGVGSYYNGQFGRCVGDDAIRAHFEAFWSVNRQPPLIFNVHYLTSEQINVAGSKAEGQWAYIQPWIHADSTSVLRSSRVSNMFELRDGVWKITRTRTENLFVAPLKAGWAERFAETSVLLAGH